jgi:hypothetical protein
VPAELGGVKAPRRLDCSPEKAFWVLPPVKPLLPYQ